MKARACLRCINSNTGIYFGILWNVEFPVILLLFLSKLCLDENFQIVFVDLLKPKMSIYCPNVQVYKKDLIQGAGY